MSTAAVKAAFRNPHNGRIFVGATHADAFAASDVKSIEDLTVSEFLKGEGFLRDGQFISREQAFDELGFATVEDMPA